MGGEKPAPGQYSRIAFHLKGTRELTDAQWADYKKDLKALARKHGAKVKISERVIIPKKPSDMVDPEE